MQPGVHARYLTARRPPARHRQGPSMALVGNESLIVQAFCTPLSHETDSRLGFLVYCMQVAMGFKKVYAEAVGGAPPGLSAASLERLSRYAMNNITVDSAQEFTNLTKIHRDVDAVLNRIDVLKRRSDEGVVKANQERDQWKTRFEDQKQVIAEASANAEREMQAQIQQKTKDLNVEHQECLKTLDAVRLELTDAKATLQMLKAQQQLGAKVDAVQETLSTTLGKLSKAEFDMVKAIDTGSIANPDVKRIIEEFARRTTTWNEDSRGINQAELERLRAENLRLTAEIASLKDTEQALRREGSPAQTQEIRGLREGLEAAKQENERLTTENAQLKRGGGDKGAELNRFLADFERNLKSVKDLPSISSGTMRVIRRSAVIPNTLRDLFTPEGRKILEQLTNDRIDLEISLWSREYLKDLVQTVQARDLGPMPNMKDLIKNPEILAINDEACTCITGFKDTQRLESTLALMTKWSDFDLKRSISLADYQVQCEATQQVYVGLTLDQEALADDKRTPAASIINYLFTQYLTMSAHIQFFKSAFANVTSDTIDILLKYHQMASDVVVKMPEDSTLAQRALNLGQAINNEDFGLTTADQNFPMLMMIQGYCTTDDDNSKLINVKLNEWEKDEDGARVSTDCEETRKTIDNLVNIVILRKSSAIDDETLEADFVSAFPTQNPTPSAGGGPAPPPAPAPTPPPPPPAATRGGGRGGRGRGGGRGGGRGRGRGGT